MQTEDNNKRDIIEQLPYLNELMVAIRNVNDTILQGKDAREAAENLLSDLPDDWMEEIGAKISIERATYNQEIEKNNSFLSSGHTQTQKQNARLAIQRVGNDYSRNVKRIVISLLKGKDLLFKTAAKREQGYHSFIKGDFEDE